MNAQAAAASNNPFEAPLADLVAPVSASPADIQQRKLKRCRRSIRAISVLYYLIGSIAGLVSFTGIVVAVASTSTEAGQQAADIGLRDTILWCVFFGSASAIFLTTAYGLWTFEKRSLRWAQGLTVLWLLRFPWGTLMGAAMLLTLCSKSAKHLFTPGNAEVTSRVEVPSSSTRTTSKREASLLSVLLLMAVLAFGCILAFFAVA